MIDPKFVIELPTTHLAYASLYSFGIGKSNLATQHRVWLEKKVVEPIRTNCWSVMGGDQSAKSRWVISRLGRASRTGDERSNLLLSEHRANSVEFAIRDALGAKGKWSAAKADVRFSRAWIGERGAAAGVPDNFESSIHRSVVVHMEELDQKKRPVPTLVPKIPKGKIQSSFLRRRYRANRSNERLISESRRQNILAKS